MVRGENQGPARGLVLGIRADVRRLWKHGADENVGGHVLAG